ncbi:ABC transporter permease [Marinomonas balearica]|uniref:Putative thiamine transport system permease protein n=1 Tax=Marinomonas balearica TaxID=491947 RepID=A0A4R6MI95_9GAMM|nr:ABC transporter permease subunit [Marinomonas balearica]TDO99929.1 putative thiamine transport system permease protein [Marinomonas balearica]
MTKTLLSPAYIMIIGLLGAPIIIGLFGILFPAFGYFPALGAQNWTLHYWQQLFSAPGLLSSVLLSVFTGVMVTIMSVWLSISLVAITYQTQWYKRLQSLLSPILSVPHASIAIGLLFLLSPSGWLLRIISPELTGFLRPPNWITVQDPFGLTLTLALIIKETPYLLFVVAAAIYQLKPSQTLETCQSLGYSRLTTWRKILLPQLYPLIRLPILIVLSFSLTVVDMALIIGPNTPTTFAVLLLSWFNDSDLSYRYVASAGAIMLVLLIAGIIFVWELTRFLLQKMARRERINGKRSGIGDLLLLIGALGGAASFVISFLSLVILPIWAIAKRWRFPDALPSQVSFSNIAQAWPVLSSTTIQTLIIAITSTLIALVVSIFILELLRSNAKTFAANKRFFGNFYSQKPLLFLMYLPILLPQIGFLFGIQVLLISFDANGRYSSVIAMHLLYVLPYVYLTLSAPYQSYNQAYLLEANRLNHKPAINFITIKLAMLKASLCTAFAIGFSVSMAQYLPTLIAGEGRITTLTTEAVTLATSGDRKKVGVFALVQIIFPILVFFAAHTIPIHWTSWRLKLKSILRGQFANRT